MRSLGYQELLHLDARRILRERAWRLVKGVGIVLLLVLIASAGCAVEYVRTPDGWRFEGWFWPVIAFAILMTLVIEARRK